MFINSVYKHKKLVYKQDPVYKHIGMLFINKILFINTVYKQHLVYKHMKALFINTILFINVYKRLFISLAD